jgi:hypothetical protein
MRGGKEATASEMVGHLQLFFETAENPKGAKAEHGGPSHPESRVGAEVGEHEKHGPACDDNGRRPSTADAAFNELRAAMPTTELRD